MREWPAIGVLRSQVVITSMDKSREEVLHSSNRKETRPVSILWVHHTADVRGDRGGDRKLWRQKACREIECSCVHTEIETTHTIGLACVVGQGHKVCFDPEKKVRLGCRESGTVSQSLL